MDSRQTVYFGGIPTEPDIKRLTEAFKVQEMNPGDTIDYEEVAIVIGQAVKSSRFRSVTTAWRKRVENDFSIIIGCSPDPLKKSFCILSESEKVDLSGKKLRSAVRLARRSYKIASFVDVKKLNEEEKKTLDHYAAKSASVIAAAQLRSGKNNLPEIR